jgi:hypothetical protein
MFQPQRTSSAKKPDRKSLINMDRPAAREIMHTTAKREVNTRMEGELIKAMVDM